MPSLPLADITSTGGANSGAAKALRATSEFLKAQGRIDNVKSDYSAFVTPKYAEAAMKLK